MLGKLSSVEIDAVLKNNFLGRIGCHDDGKTYVVPINYVYDGKDIIAHSISGMKIQMMRRNPQVCFEVDELTNFTNWKSVIVWGEYQEITGAIERYHAIKYFVEKVLPLKISETAIPPEISIDGIYFKTGVNTNPLFTALSFLKDPGGMKQTN